MLPKKSKKGDLESKKITFLLIGITLVLGLVYVGFELYATPPEKSSTLVMSDPHLFIDESAPATDKTPPPPPPKEAPKNWVMKIVDETLTDSKNWDNLFNVDFFPEEIIPEPLEIENDYGKPEPAPIPYYVEEMPRFVGGEEALYHFLLQNLNYPEKAKQNEIQGTVILDFVVEKDGSIGEIRTFIPLFPDCDQEAIRVVKMLPKFIPGKVMGKPVRVWYRLPVSFKMSY